MLKCWRVKPSDFNEPRLRHGLPLFKAPHSQQGSILFSIPTELRGMILGYLFQAGDGIIFARTEVEEYPANLNTNTRHPYRASLSRSSQLLRTCQHLYLESLNLLYNDKTLGILVDAQGVGLSACYLLEYCVMQFYSVWDNAPIQYSVLQSSNDGSRKIYRKMEGAAVAVSRRKWAAIRSTLQRFSRFYIAILDSDSDARFNAVRMLKRLLDGKQVSIEVIDKRARPTLVPEISDLSFLRCRSIDIMYKWQHAEAVPSHSRMQLERKVQELMRNISGPSPAYDTSNLYQAFRAELIHWKPISRRSTFPYGDVLRQITREMRHAATFYDTELFETKVQQVLPLLEEWNGEIVWDCVAKDERESSRIKEEAELRIDWTRA